MDGIFSKKRMVTFKECEASLTANCDALRSWLLGPAATLWLDRSVDRRSGGFFDQLSFEDASNACDLKRLRVCARQIFVFAELARLGVPDAEAAVQHGLDYLFTRLRHPAGGFIRSTRLDGTPLDETRDLYDHAFVVFALAAAHRLTGDAALLDEARGVLRLVTGEMSHPAGGFIEALPPVHPRRQNPHMHLLEACLAWAAQVQDPLFVSLAEDLIDLFEKRFRDSETGILFEFFDDDWSLPADPARRTFEPGHHFEWIWLLGEARRIGIGSADRQGIAPSLAAIANRGFGAAGLPYGSLRLDPAGKAVPNDTTCRIWVVTEWLRACLVEPDSGVGSAAPALARLQQFLDVPVQGLWHERCDADTGRFATDPVPASSLYHITSALIPVITTAGRPQAEQNEGLRA